jgi:hypothetical protein
VQMFKIKGEVNQILAHLGWVFYSRWLFQDCTDHSQLQRKTSGANTCPDWIYNIITITYKHLWQVRNLGAVVQISAHFPESCHLQESFRRYFSPPFLHVTDHTASCIIYLTKVCRQDCRQLDYIHLSKFSYQFVFKWKPTIFW